MQPSAHGGKDGAVMSTSPQNQQHLPTQQHAVLKIGDYILSDTIGRGSFGKVKLGTHQGTKMKVAIKIMSREKLKSLECVEKTRREIQTMRLFKHPHIIKLYQVISTPTDIFLVMEYVCGGELFDYIVKKGKLSEKEARKFFQQIISGIDYCHKQRIVHRDIKPENLLLDKHGNVKIADFGLSNIMSDGEFLSTSCGSPNYAAPEVISAKLYAGPEVDIWSCGIVLYALLCGTLPFDDDHVPTLFKKIKSGTFFIPEFLKKDVVDLLMKMLQVDPMKRATITDIKQSNWFQKDLPEYLFPDDAGHGRAFNPSIILDLSRKHNISVEEIYDQLKDATITNPLLAEYELMNDSLDTEQSPFNKGEFYVVGGGSNSGAAGAISPGAKSPRGGAIPRQTNQLPTIHHPERANVIEPVAPAGRIRLHSMSETVSASASGGRHSMPPSTSAPATFSRRAGKWHLGIRSSSHPKEIMGEVFRALKLLNYTWKVKDPYHIHVRYQNNVTRREVHMSLQLYHIDGHQYLLDFVSISPQQTNNHNANNNIGAVAGSMDDDVLPAEDGGAMAAAIAAHREQRHLSGDSGILKDSASQGLLAPHSHQVMEFFEMCASLITALAR